MLVQPPVMGTGVEEVFDSSEADKNAANTHFAGLRTIYCTGSGCWIHVIVHTCLRVLNAPYFMGTFKF